MTFPQIPGYEILAPLPQGGMSAVFKARQLSLDRVVVVKMLPHALDAPAAEVGKFFWAEARLTAQLKHPNIVQIYDFGQTPEGIYYFVMEFISGYSVAEWIRRKKCLSRQDALVCARWVAEALAYAWETAGVIHCDIKPDNVIIDGDGTVKVADLGLARSVRSALDRARFEADLAVGTPYYISPEQSQARLELDCRTDIYSLGAMLYHCLTGKLPFEGLPLTEIMDRQISDRIPDLVEIKPEASMAMACLVEKMMAKDREHRQKDWPEVIRDLTRMRSDLLPEGPLPPSGASTMQRCAAREQWLQAGATTAAPLPAPPLPETVPQEAMLPISAPPARNATHPPAAPGAQPLRAGSVAGGPARNATHSVVGGPARNATHSVVGGPARSATHSVAGGLPPRRKLFAFAAGFALLIIFVGSLVALNKFAQLKRAKLAPAGQPASAPGATVGRPAFVPGTSAVVPTLREVGTMADKPAGRPAGEGPTVVADLPAEAPAPPAIAPGTTAGEPETKPSKESEVLAMAKPVAAPPLAKEQERLAQETVEQQRQKVVEEQSRQWQSLLNNVAAQLVEGNPGAALAVVQQVTNATAFVAQRTELLALERLLSQAGNMNQHLLDSFRAQQDQEIIVTLTNGPERLVVRDVRGDTILVEKRVVVQAGELSHSKMIRLQDLTLAEKKARLPAVATPQALQAGLVTSALPETKLLQGLLELDAGDAAAAEASWRQAGSSLSVPLIEQLQERKKRQEENLSRSDFELLLRAAQVEVGNLPATEQGLVKGEALPARNATHSVAGGPDPATVLAAIYQKKYSARQAQALAKRAASYQQQHGQSAFAQAYAPVLAALQHPATELTDETAPDLPKPRPARPPAAPGAQLLRAGNVAGGRPTSGQPNDAGVRQELLARNLGLTEYNISLVTDDQGRIVRAELISADLRDIQPLTGLWDLRAVVCAGAQPQEWHAVPVQAPLSNLSPLRGLPLQGLSVNSTRVKDLSPLAGMPLTRLNLDGSQVVDLSVLKGMPLRELTLSRLAIRDLRFLAGLPLEFLNISYTEIGDLAPLAGMKLKRLVAQESRISELTALRGMPLVELDISRTKVSNLNPLTGMELEYLDLSQTRVRDLAPLKAIPLKRLDISETDVRDLTPLKGLPLKSLALRDTAVRDLTPIKDSPIEEIWLDFHPDQEPPAHTFWAFRAVLMQMPELQKINGNAIFGERRWRK